MGSIVLVAVAVAGVAAILFTFVPSLWSEVKAVARSLDRDRPSPFEQNLLIGATAVGAFLAYKRGIGPIARRRARAAWVVFLGAWAFLTWTRHDSWIPNGDAPAAAVCLAVVAALTIGLLVTRIRRHLHGTWRPHRDFFVVEDPGPPWR